MAERAEGSSFVGDVFKLVTGNAFCRVLGYAATPVVAAMYSPANWGAAGVFAALSAVVGSVACLTYDLAIMLPKDDEEAANVLGLSALLAGLAALATWLVVALAGPQICRTLKAPGVAPYLWLLPVSVLTAAVVRALEHWVSRHRRFGLLAVNRALTSATIILSQLAYALAGRATPGSLVWASLAGQAVSLLLLGGWTWHMGWRLMLGCVNVRGMWREAKRYRRFPLVNLWGVLINTVSWRAPMLLLSRLYGQETAGYFQIATKIAREPISLLGSAVGRVFYQRASDLHARGEDMASLVREVYRRLAAFSIFPMLLAILVAPDLVLVVCGPTWLEAGRHVAILCPSLLLVFLSSPLSSLFLVYERQGSLLLIQIAIFAARVGALVAAGALGLSASGAILLLSAGVAVAYAGLLVWCFRLASVPGRRAVGLAWRYLLYILPCAAFWIPMRAFDALSPAGSLIVAGAVLALYFVKVAVRDRVLVRFLHERGAAG